MINVSEFMTDDLFTLKPHDTLESASQLMREQRIRHVPIVNDKGVLVGLVTLSDVLATSDSTLRDAADRADTSCVTLADIMTSDVITVDEHASLRQCARFLEEHKISCLPVVTRGKLRGIITDTDFVAVAINLIEQMEQIEAIELEDF
ncbi:MAG: CBS domain-containing protein [Gammaproteobacteria bacterium]|nr:CBS domain-containing protein [Gammaproteobacteria bacterium]